MTATFMLEVIEPKKVILSQEVQMATFPGIQGRFGLLPDHSALMTLLIAGSIEIFEKEEVKERFFLTRGFLSMENNHCTVLAEQILCESDIALSKIEEEKRLLEQSLLEAQNPVEKKDLEDKLKVLEAQREFLQKAS